MSKKEKAIHCIVLEKPLGANAEGDVIQVDEDTAKGLIAGGFAREATQEDLGASDEGDEAIEEETLSEEGSADNIADEEKEDDEEDDMEKIRRSIEENIIAKVSAQLTKELNKSKVKRPNLNVNPNAHVAHKYDGSGGFKSMGHYLKALIAAEDHDYEAVKQISNYKQMRAKKMGISTKDMLTTVTTAGGLFVPEQWADQIWKLSFASVPNLLDLFTKYEMRNKEEHIPVAVQASGSSAIVAQWQTEGSAIPETDAVSEEVVLTLNNLFVLCNISDQLLRFSNPYNLEAFFNSYVPERFAFTLNQSIIQGGNGQVNIIGNSAVVGVDRAVANRISFPDVTAMYTACHDSFKSEAVWLIQSSAITELFALAFPNATGSYPTPVFLPTGQQWTGGIGNMAYAPVGTLLGRPVLCIENMSALGTTGDFALVHFKSMAAGSIDIGGAMTPYLYFNKALNTFRWGIYVASANPMYVPYERQDGSYASNCVVLDAHS